MRVGPLSCGMTDGVMMGEHIISRSCRRRRLRVIFNGKEIQFFGGRAEKGKIFLAGAVPDSKASGQLVGATTPRARHLGLGT